MLWPEMERAASHCSGSAETAVRCVCNLNPAKLQVHVNQDSAAKLNRAARSGRFGNPVTS